MTKENNNLKEALLNQMNESPDSSSQIDIVSAQKIIARDEARFKHLKWVTIITWLLAVLSNFIFVL